MSAVGGTMAVRLGKAGLRLGREADYLRILEAAARVQEQVAAILEAKAFEAEKAKHWITNQTNHTLFNGQDELLRQAGAFHESVLEVIEGITKMELGLARNLKALLDKGDAGDGMDGFGDLMGSGGGGLR